MRIFVSYSAKDKHLVEKIVLSLRTRGHQVFFDEDSLSAGHEYEARIEREISKCHRFVFCVSAASLADRAFTLTELEIAKRRWPNPDGKVFAVILDETTIADLPPYLAAVTVLRPKGNIPAEVAIRFSNKRRSWLIAMLLAVVAAATILIGAWFLNNRVDAILRNHLQPIKEATSQVTYPNSSNRYQKILENLLKILSERHRVQLRTSVAWFDDRSRLLTVGENVGWEKDIAGIQFEPFPLQTMTVEQQKWQRGVSGYVFFSGVGVNVRDVREIGASEPYSYQRFPNQTYASSDRSLVSVPISVSAARLHPELNPGDNIVGVLSVSTDTIGEFDGDDERIVRIFSDLIYSAKKHSQPAINP